MKQILIVLFSVGLCAQSSWAGGRPAPAPPPNANNSGCTIQNMGSKIQERVNQGVRDVINADDASGRVDAVKKTLNDVVNCGKDGLSDGMDRVTGDSQGSDDDSAGD